MVHVHNFAKALSSSVMRAALDRGFELIITLHDFQLGCPTGNLFVHQTQQKCTLQPMSARAFAPTVMYGVIKPSYGASDVKRYKIISAKYRVE